MALDTTILVQANETGRAMVGGSEPNLVSSGVMKTEAMEILAEEEGATSAVDGIGGLLLLALGLGASLITVYEFFAKLWLARLKRQLGLEPAEERGAHSEHANRGGSGPRQGAHLEIDASKSERGTPPVAADAPVSKTERLRRITAGVALTYFVGFIASHPVSAAEMLREIGAAIVDPFVMASTVAAIVAAIVVPLLRRRMTRRQLRVTLGRPTDVLWEYYVADIDTLLSWIRLNFSFAALAFVAFFVVFRHEAAGRVVAALGAGVFDMANGFGDFFANLFS